MQEQMLTQQERLSEIQPRRSSFGLLQRKCACGGTPGPDGECAACKAKRLAVQRRAESPAAPGLAPPLVHDVLRSSGQPLDPQTRALMEPRFGHDFSKVRVHADSRAAESAQAVNARAYTVGNQVAFGAGQYAPTTETGRKLIAHELTHVVQQSGNGSIGNSLAMGAAHSPHEREADALSAQIGGSNPTSVARLPISVLTGAPAAVVQRGLLDFVVGGAAVGGGAGAVFGPPGGAVAGAGIGAAAGALGYIWARHAAQNYGRSLATMYPGWLTRLADCPCHLTDVVADPVHWVKDENPILSYFHPGAAASYRSVGTWSTAPGTAHGQQCTYDSSGGLITAGPGAGTPDVWSPNASKPNHIRYDVLTWEALGWSEYNRYWTPNNGRGCASNSGDRTIGRRLRELIPF